MNVLEHENIALGEENIKDDIDHTLFSSEDEDDDLNCMCVKMITMMRKGCLISMQPLKILMKTGHC